MSEKSKSESKAKTTLDEALERLASLVETSAASKEIRRYLKAVALFHEYSWFNALLIMFQRPDATRVAGYKTWQKLGRQVKKGERGIIIAAPVFVKVKSPKGAEDQRAEDQPAEAEVRERLVSERLVGFRDVYVFDISQTEGEALPEPQWWANRPADERLLDTSWRDWRRAIELAGLPQPRHPYKIPPAEYSRCNSGQVISREGWHFNNSNSIGGMDGSLRLDGLSPSLTSA